MDASATIEPLLHACVALATGALALAGAAVRPLPRPSTGARGQARARALRSQGFALLEPVLRYVGAVLAQVLPPDLRARIDAQLTGGDGLAGLGGDEVAALCALSGSLLGAGALALGASPALALAIACFGFAAPFLQAREKAGAYQRAIARTLPAAIDVMALSMGAGLGFAAALDIAAREAVDAQAPLGRELRHVRQAIATGHSRKVALEALALRVPCETVRDFVAAVVQGELKGTPLAGVLEVQARTLRTRRAVLAEEAAARASVLLVLPLLLLLGAVMLLMFGPFIVNGMGF